MATDAENQAELDELQIVKKNIILGKQVQTIGTGDDNITYTRANIGMIDLRIRQLQRALGLSARGSLTPRF